MSEENILIGGIIALPIYGHIICKEKIDDPDGKYSIPSGTTGVLTGYEPTFNMFVVRFTEELWVTFRETLEEFEKHCTVVLTETTEGKEDENVV